MEEKLYYAVQANDVTSLRWQLDEGVNVNTLFTGQQCPFGRHYRWSALHFCCEKGHYDCAQLLLESGADPNIYDKWNQTPLAYAIQTQWHNLVELLLAHRADVNVQDRKGRTPVHFCVEYIDDICVRQTEGVSESARLIRTLTRSGANPNLGDILGRTALWICTHEDGHLDQVRALLEAKCDVNIQDVREKRTALQAAIMHANKDRMSYVRLLLATGTDVNKRDARNHNAFMNVVWRSWQLDGECVSDEDLEICSLILKSDFDVNRCSEKTTWIEYGGNALALATERGACKLVDMLLNHGADPDITDDQNNTPLIMSVHKNKISCTARLLQCNPNLDAIGTLKLLSERRHLTAFQCACACGYTDIAILLVRAGYNLNQETYLWTNENVPDALVNNIELWAWLRNVVIQTPTLVDLCRMRVRCIMGKRLGDINNTSLPRFLKDLLFLDNIVAPWLKS